MIARIAAAQRDGGDSATEIRTLSEAMPARASEKGWPEGSAGLARALAIAHARAGNVLTAIEVAAPIGPSFEKERAFDEIARIRAEQGDVEGTSRAIRAMGDTSYSPVVHTHGTYGWLALALTKRGQLDSALRVVDSSCICDLTPGILAAMAEALVKIGDRAAATRLFDQALKVADALPLEAALGSPIRWPARRAVARHQARAGDVHAALAIVRGSDNGLSIIELAMIQADQGDRSGARSTLVLVSGLKWPPLWELIEAQAAIGDVDGALASYQAYRKRPGRLRALLNEVVAPQSSSNETKDKDVRGPKAFALVPVMEAQARAGDIEGARRTAEAIRREASQYDDWTTGSLLAAMAEGGKAEEALAAAIRIRDSTFATHAFLSVAEGLARRARAPVDDGWRIRDGRQASLTTIPGWRRSYTNDAYLRPSQAVLRQR